MISQYNGQDATVLSTPARPIDEAGRSRYAMPEDHPTKQPARITTKPVQPLSLASSAAFWPLVDHRTYAECWPWRGRTSLEGYGRFGSYYAHRVMYTLMRGPIPAGLTIDHVCGNRACMNPQHMEAVTLSENVLRGHRAKRDVSYPHPKRDTPKRIGRRRARGLCAQCNTPSETFRCQQCNRLERERRKAAGNEREQVKARHARNRAAGLCIYCSMPANGSYTCERCRLRRIECSRLRRERAGKVGV